MTDQDIRMKCLELAMPKTITNPDPSQIVARARQFLAFVTETGNPGHTRPILTADTSKSPRKI